MGVADRRQREKLLRKQNILDAAALLFSRDGFMKVKMVDVARQCELSTGALYLYFRSKEDIFAALAVAGSEKMDVVLQESFILDGAWGRDQLAALFERLIEEYGGYGVYFDALKNHYLGNHQMLISEEHEEALQRMQIAIFNRMVEFLERQQGLGVVSSDWNLQELCFILWAQLLGVAQVLGEGRNRLLTGKDLQGFLLNYADFILAGLSLHSPPGQSLAR